MNFEDKFSKAVNDVVSGEQGITIEEIREILEEDYEYTLELKHGSKNFQGEKLDLGQAGSRRDQKNDAYGTGFYMTNKETIARGYAGKEGQIVVADFTITEENTSNFMYPYDHREFLEEVVLGSPDAYGYFINSYEASAPPYDHDFECYECPETCEEIECTYDEYLETFGGLRDIFRSRYFMPMNDKSANNPIDDFVAGLMNEDSLYDALMTVEGELYCPNSSDTQKNVLAANLLNEKKAEYGIQAGLVDEGEGSLVVVITDPDAIDIKEIQQLKPKSPSLKL